MTLKNFRAEDFDNQGDKPVKTAASKNDKRAQSSEPTPTTQPITAPDAGPEDVPSGTVPEVMTWVGDDPVRAQKALDAEVENDKPRKGLVEQLSEMIDAEADSDSKTEQE